MQDQSVNEQFKATRPLYLDFYNVKGFLKHILSILNTCLKVMLHIKLF